MIRSPLKGHIREVSVKCGSKRLPVYSVTNVRGFVLSTEQFDKEVFSRDQSKYKIVTRGQLAYNPSRINVGSVAILRHADEVCVSPMYVVFECKDSLSADYLLYFLRTARGLCEILHRCEGTVRFQLRYKDLERIEIPIPIRDEQERIVSILDAADEVRRLRSQADKCTAELVTAIFHDMFGDPATNPKGWPIYGLSDDEVGKLDRGRSRHRPRDASHLYGGPYPFVQTGDVTNSHGVIKTYSQTYSDAGLEQSKLWPRGTLCITIAANIAHTGILDFDACFPDSIVGFIPGPRASVEYVRAWFTTVQGRLERAAPQSAQKNINLRILRELSIPLPPKNLQLEFAARVDSVRELGRSQTTSNQRLIELFQSLLHRSFEGEL